ncbi:uncharacterized protein [Neodiprion pinetum]|uniref:Uncharacterized protein LOC107225224 n=1 Tax=Neodiprion lecontei TaxID=441921 RepID=A0A6J0C3N6_NEOLC|nr:uncharacterized protein LOC107225224 [Neodiprion lecontei]XP_046412396.1 uncharacterized protein LOC124175846 [Neodiprion fabricii]XP_046470243.1 uncharacterized protein LOC124213221 [Neodiprion pinetum]XP_046605282.1 uncharacterized protein LOC124297916 [Neodiprion virginianus]
MTMEDRSGGMERAAPATVNNVTSSSPSDASYPLQRSVKRSFDVAFLVAPDENLARRQSEKLRLVSTESLTEKRNQRLPEVNVTTDHEADKMPQNLTIKHYDHERKILDSPISPPYVSPRLQMTSPPKVSPDNEPTRRYSLPQLHKTPSPPIFLNQTSLNKSLDSAELVVAKGYDPVPSPDKNESRSAFTKVAFTGQKNGFDSSQVSPRSSVSPDQLSYQSSISPPVNLSNPPSYKYASFPGKVAYPFLMNHEAQQNSILENLKMPQISQPPKDFSNQIPSPKVAGFRAELSPVYPNLPYNPISVFPPMAEALARPRFLATAGVTGLLPPSFAALTLPAQNVCAKCNLSFRMTSDLVYHMRSHHKSENAGEAARRRREEKLRCPVCDESFRERHHLTRHMTAHQDKESDAIVDQVEIKRRATAVQGK